MSLLIKALASAEKDKQAELSKKHSKASKAETASALELAPKDANAPESLQSTVAEVAEKSLENAKENNNLSLEQASFVDDGLSLALEAGLVTHGDFEYKAAKSKSMHHPAKNKAESSKDQSPASAAATISALPVASSLAPASLAQSNAVPQKAAANVFVANQPVKSSNSKTALILLGVAGVLMIGLGIVGSRYISDLIAPEVVIVKRADPPPLLTESAEVTSGENAPVTTEQVEPISIANQNVASAVEEASLTAAAEVPKKPSAFEPKTAFKKADNLNAVARDEVNPAAVNPSRVDRSEGGVTQPTSSRRSVQVDPARQSTLQLTSRTPVAGVDPTLLAAYQALSRGEDASAQQQYRQVLQRDVRNIDALLGMAAIAERQGREADAAGWYQKVLEIEPRNTIAQSAIVRPQANGDVVAAESRIKNMLAQQPEAANLHAALGNLYAEQNQWAAAQDAYFNASRFAPNSADYAFNLAISLDQLGKSGLALAQYRRALDLLNSSGASTPDRAQLETRIQALQVSN